MRWIDWIAMGFVVVVMVLLLRTANGPSGWGSDAELVAPAPEPMQSPELADMPQDESESLTPMATEPEPGERRAAGPPY